MHVRFEDNTLVSGNWAPFIEHDVMQVEKSASGAVDKAVGFSLPGVAKECTDERFGSELAS